MPFCKSADLSAKRVAFLAYCRRRELSPAVHLSAPPLRALDPLRQPKRGSYATPSRVNVYTHSHRLQWLVSILYSRYRIRDDQLIVDLRWHRGYVSLLSFPFRDVDDPSPGLGLGVSPVRLELLRRNAPGSESSGRAKG